jgi:hypothetical protein
LKELTPQRVHLSFDDKPYRMAMGLVACRPDEMIELDDQYLPEMAERRDLLADRHDEVFAAIPGSEAARAEVLSRLAALLPLRHPETFARDGDWLHNRLTGESWDVENPVLDPLEVAGRLVQEDLCVLLPSAAGPVLAAAVLCFPSRWSLAEKIGRPLAEIHRHVPLYAERLARPVDRLMPQLREGRMVERLNWSIVDDPALFQPKGKFRHALNAAVTEGNAGETLFMRVERQTLSRQPISDSTLFTIRVHRYPLARIASDPGIAAELAGAVRQLPEEMQLYKSIPTIRAALLGYLDARASA